MRVLIACECSGIVRDAFRARGHDAVSCDLKPSQTPGPHYQCDVREILHETWDIMIAHPVCRYLTNAGVRWLYERPGRWEAMREAAAFFLLLERADHIPQRCVENPIMHRHAIEIIGRKASQYIQPWQFGDPFQKATGLWLTNLPPLRPEQQKADWPAGAIRQDVWLMPPSADREEKRSLTYPGIARAMAEQWGNRT